MSHHSKVEYRNGYVVVYCDGACSNNGRNGASAGIGVFWGDGHPDNISSALTGYQTNQRAELNAAIAAMDVARERGYPKLHICTDSHYVMKGATEWCHNWLRNGWRNLNDRPVANRDDWITLLDLLNEFEDVIWEHTPSHSGNYGNEMADRLACRAL